MGIFDSPRHTLELQLFEESAGSIGQRKPVPYGDRIPIRVNIQPLTSEERLNLGLQLKIVRRVSAREWPGDYLSRGYFEGYEWETLGEPQHYTMGRGTPHYVIIMQRGAKDGAGQ